MKLRAVIPGKPTAWARTGGSGNRRFEKAPQREWKNLCRMAMYEAKIKAGCGSMVPFNGGPVRLTIVAIWPLPKGRELKRDPRPRGWRTQTPDFDNISKIIGDAGNAYWWRDDALICDARVIKLIGEQGEAPRVIVTAESIKEPAHEFEF